jgi:hypothetical protein
MRVTKNKLKEEYVSHPKTLTSRNPNPKSHHSYTPTVKAHISPCRYGALSTNLQSANNNATGTPTPKTPTKKGTPRATTVTPASRKRARKIPEMAVGNGESGSDDEEEVPVGKKAKAATPAKRGEVKSEPGQDVEVGGEEGEVNFF